MHAWIDVNVDEYVSILINILTYIKSRLS